MSKWMDYSMDSRKIANPFLNAPKSQGGKGILKKYDKNIYLGGQIAHPSKSSAFFIGNIPFNTHPLSGMTQYYSGSGLPLLPPKSRYNSSRLAKDDMFFN